MTSTCNDCAAWRKITGCKTPQEAKVWLTAIQQDITELRRMIREEQEDP
jgi:hypothetical protein